MGFTKNQVEQEMETDKITQQYIKALKNENLNQALLDSLPYPAVLIRQDRVIVAMNKTVKEAGVNLGTFCWDTLGQRASISDADRVYYETHKCVPEKGIKCVFCMCDQAFESATAVIEKVTVGESLFNTYWVPLGEGLLLHYFIEIKS